MASPELRAPLERMRSCCALDELPPHAAALIAEDAPWFRATEAAALPFGARAHYVFGAGAVMPMWVQSGRLRSMTTPYTWNYAPAGDIGPEALAFARHCRRFPVTTLEAIEETAFWLPSLEAAMRRAGLVVSRFAHFGNWSEALAGRDWAAYLAARPGRLREVLRRRSRDAGSRLRHEIIASPAGIARGIAAYEQVYASSWKVPEPYPEFGPTLLRHTAAAGSLRLALLWQDDVPIAAQYWLLRRGVATVLKLAHDEAYKPLSPGTLLTAWTIRHLIEADGIEALDFGRGDDPYKRMWATHRRQRIGLVAATPWRAAGLFAILRQAAGAAARRLAPAARSEPNP